MLDIKLYTRIFLARALDILNLYVSVEAHVFLLFCCISTEIMGALYITVRYTVAHATAFRPLNLVSISSSCGPGSDIDKWKIGLTFSSADSPMHMENGLLFGHDEIIRTHRSFAEY